MRKFFIWTLLLFFSLSTYAGRIVHKVNHANNPFIELKWYADQLISSNGIYVERQTDNSWIRLHQTPIKYAQYRPANSVLQADSILAEMIAFLPKSTPVKIEGVVLLNILVKSFQSTEFSKYLGIYFKDTTVSTNQLYTYRIVDSGTNEVIAISENISTSRPSSLLPPKEVHMNQKGKNVAIGWQAEPNRYYAVNVYRKSPVQTEYQLANEFPIMASLDSNDQSNEYFFSERLDGIRGTIYYKLVALSFFGDTSSTSAAYSIQVNTKNPPLPVGYFEQDTIIDSDITFKWNNPNDSTIVGYQLYERLRQKGLAKPLFDELLPNISQSYTYKNVPPGDHYFNLSSVNSYGEEAKSTTLLVRIEDMLAPVAPVDLFATIDSGSIYFSWKHASPEPKMGYQLMRSITPNNEDFTLMNSEPISETKYIDKIDIRTTSPFFYKVIAVDSAWNKSQGSNIVKAQLPDRTPPSKPVITTCKFVDDYILIKWLKNAEGDLEKYFITKKGTNDQNFVFQSIDNIYIDKNIQSAEQWKYIIQAQDSSGNISKISEEWSITVPIKVQKLTEAIKLKVKHSKHNYKLKWEWTGNKQPIVGFMVIGGKGTSLTPKSGLIKSNKLRINIDNNTTIQIKAIGTQGEIWVSNIYKSKE